MMRSLRSFFLTLRGLFSKRGGSLDVIVGPNENLSRFIFSSRHFGRQPPRVKAEAYMPHRGEVSVFRVDGLTNAKIWEIGIKIATSRDRPLYARGDTAAHKVRRIGLEAMPAEPPLHHARSWAGQKTTSHVRSLWRCNLLRSRLLFRRIERRQRMP